MSPLARGPEKEVKAELIRRHNFGFGTHGDRQLDLEEDDLALEGFGDLADLGSVPLDIAKLVVSVVV